MTSLERPGSPDSYQQMLSQVLLCTLQVSNEFWACSPWVVFPMLQTGLGCQQTSICLPSCCMRCPKDMPLQCLLPSFGPFPDAGHNHSSHHQLQDSLMRCWGCLLRSMLNAVRLRTASHPPGGPWQAQSTVPLHAVWLKTSATSSERPW